MQPHGMHATNGTYQGIFLLLQSSCSFFLAPMKYPYIIDATYCCDGWSEPLQTEVQLSCACTLNQWFLHIVAVGGLCMPTNECSNGWWTAIKQFPNQWTSLLQPSSHTSNIYIQTSNLECHCNSTPLLTKQKFFCSTGLIGVLGPVWRQDWFLDIHIGPQGAYIQHTTAQAAQQSYIF